MNSSRKEPVFFEVLKELIDVALLKTQLYLNFDLATGNLVGFETTVDAEFLKQIDVAPQPPIPSGSLKVVKEPSTTVPTGTTGTSFGDCPTDTEIVGTAVFGSDEFGNGILEGEGIELSIETFIDSFTQSAIFKLKNTSFGANAVLDGNVLCAPK